MIEVFEAINTFWSVPWPSGLGIVVVLTALCLGAGIGHFCGYEAGYSQGRVDTERLWGLRQ